jgi:hypothetical protein
VVIVVIVVIAIRSFSVHLLHTPCRNVISQTENTICEQRHKIDTDFLGKKQPGIFEIPGYWQNFTGAR